MPSFPNPLCLGHSPVWMQSPVKDSPSWRFLNSIPVFTVLQPSPPCMPFSFNQGIVSVCIHFLIWTVSPTSPPCASHMLYKCVKSVPACSNVAPFNCRNTAVSTDKSTRYAEKITGKNPVLFTQPHSSTRRICLGGCREEITWSTDPKNKPVWWSDWAWISGLFSLKSVAVSWGAAPSLNLVSPLQCLPRYSEWGFFLWITGVQGADSYYVCIAWEVLVLFVLLVSPKEKVSQGS